MSKKVTYKESGVDIEAGYKAVQKMKAHVQKTLDSNVLSGIGGFGGLYSIANEKLDEPVLVAGTDGVGTKLKVAFMLNKHHTIGIDCVAMCVNDILCQGAKPLFFLDYIATGKLSPDHVAQIVDGIARGCLQAGAALIGGETAEMPGLYQSGEYDVAGFAVGIVERSKIIDGSRIATGDSIIGLPSSGLHSNGFSLVRKIFFDIHNYKVNSRFIELELPLGEELIKPTKIYVKPVYQLLQEMNYISGNEFIIKGLSHITGGGFYENIPRMLPEDKSAKITLQNIKTPPVFYLLQQLGNIDEKEMYATFNMGIGLVMVVDKKYTNKVLRFLDEQDENPVLLGEVIDGKQDIVID